MNLCNILSVFVLCSVDLMFCIVFLYHKKSVCCNISVLLSEVCYSNLLLILWADIPTVSLTSLTILLFEVFCSYSTYEMKVLWNTLRVFARLFLCSFVCLSDFPKFFSRTSRKYFLIFWSKLGCHCLT